MTDEELDQARAAEAWCLHVALPGDQRLISNPALIAARLAREGWTPVDPDLVEAREVCARRVHAEAPDIAKGYRDGDFDDQSNVLCARFGIARGRELERQLIGGIVAENRKEQDGWIEWFGGKNPAPGKKVEMRMRGGALSQAGASDGLVWVHGLGDADIVAYRVIK